MNTLSKLLLVLFAVFSLSACEDEITIPDTDYPDDTFIGSHDIIELAQGLEEYTKVPYTCYIKTPDGTTIRRSGTVVQTGEHPALKLRHGLKDGTYQLLYLEYELTGNEDSKYTKAQHGLGCKISISNGRTTLLDNYNSAYGMFGSGTKEDPYIITSYNHLLELTFAIEDGDKNAATAVYRQDADIDMDYASFRCDNNFGWLPIGTASNPFSGTYIGASTDGTINTISYLWAKTRDMTGIGLFGYLLDAKIDSLNITNAEMKGDGIVGVIAGGILQAGEKRYASSISNCSVSSATVCGYDEGDNIRSTMMMGGILGGLDLNAIVIISSCKIDDTTINATCNAGGIVGGTGIYSSLTINNCSTAANCNITSDYSGAGGIVGSCDTLIVNGCTNNATVKGAACYTPGNSQTAGFGTGGICGGSGISFITASLNHGEVTGYAGVGGIIGSTRIGGSGSTSDPMTYNTTYLRYCGNTGNVSGDNSIGGLCGEAQFGCFGGYNTGNISGKGDYVSGGVGNTSLGVAHNMVNTGNVSGRNFVSGIISKTEFGSVAFSQNYGNITSKNASTHTGGLCAIATNNTVFHHCGNFGTVTGNGSVGGIVGELGHIDETSGVSIAQTVMVVVDVTSAFFVGPIVGVVIGSAAGAVKRVAQAISVGTSFILAGIDNAILIYPFAQHYDEKEWETLCTDVSTTVDKNMKDISTTLSQLRKTSTDNLALYEGLEASTLSECYSNGMDKQLEYYTTSNNDSIINTNINNKRIALADDVSSMIKTKNIVHAAFSGIAILATVSFSTISAFATGGASLIFQTLGMVSTAVGGAVSVSQLMQESTANAVIVSQCVNAGNVKCNNGELYRIGGIVGHLADHGMVYDCLNTAGVRGGHLVGTAETKSSIRRCASVWKNSSTVSSTSNLFYRTYGAGYSDLAIFDNRTYASSDCNTIAFEDLNNAKAYPWKIGEKESWHIPNGASFPIPYFSEMRNQ